MLSQFNKVCTNNIVLSKLSFSKSTKEKKADISRIPSPIPPRPSKSILAKYKFYNINSLLLLNSKPYIKSYAQVSRRNINDIIKVKKAFLKLSFSKVSEVHNIINKTKNKGKPKVNITTKSPSHKQIIILIGANNMEKIISQVEKHIKNINRLLIIFG